MKEKKFKDVYIEYKRYLILKQKKSSVRSITNRIENYIMPYFKEESIFSLTSKKYLDWQIHIDNKNLKYSYKSTLHTCFVTFLNYCIKFHNLDKNVASMVGNFKNNDIEVIKELWDIKEFNNFIKVVDDYEYNILFKMLFFTGLREGEILSLTWNDIDFLNKKISIYKTATRFFDNNKKRIITNPKTKKSNREIGIDNILNKELKELLKIQKKQYNYFNLNYFVFGGNKTIPPTTLTRKKNLYCDKAKVKRITIHDFRHSHSILLYTNNVPIKEISNRLGHSSISMTTDIYLKHMPIYEKNAIKTLNSLRLN